MTMPPMLGDADRFAQQADAHEKAARWPEAEKAWRASLVAAPRSLLVMMRLAMAVLKRGTPAAGEEAAALCREVVRRRPDDAEAWNNLGVSLTQAGRITDAIDAYRRAVRSRPGLAEAWLNLGVLLIGLDDTDAAVAALGKAAELRPADARPLNNMGVLLRRRGDLAGAEAVLRRAVPMAGPAFWADVVGNLACVLALRGGAARREEARDAVTAAVTAAPWSAGRHRDVGFVMLETGRAPEALAAYRAAYAMDPTSPDNEHGLAMAHLTLGDWGEGWEHYEARFGTAAFDSIRRAMTPGPAWDGGELAGRTLLLQAEQGAGDVVMFARFAGELAERGARVIARTPESLRRLMAQVDGVAEAVGERDAVPAFDVQAMIGSLGRLLRVRPDDVRGGRVPYLRPEPAAVEAWRRRLAEAGAGRWVGVAWAGSANHVGDRRRSAAVADFAALAGVPGVKLVSLQVPPDGRGGAAAEIGAMDVSDGLRDFADTAALIAALDHVVCVDTAVGHIAGALGRPTSLLIAEVCDWRWGLEGETTGWYPRHRLYRRGGENDEPWRAVVLRVASDLYEGVGGGHGA